MRVRQFTAGERIIRQKERSAAVYFLLSGRLAVRVQRGDHRETVAWLQPPDVFGELSFVTGRPSIADVETVVDTKVAALAGDALAPDAPYYAALMQGLTRMIAERMRAVVSGGVPAPPAPVVLLVPDPAWIAPRSFAVELVKA